MPQTATTIDLAAQLALLALASFTRILAERAQLDGKTEAQLIRQTLAGLDANEIALIKTLLKAQAKKEGKTQPFTQALSENLIEMGELLPVLQRALTVPTLTVVEV